MIKKALLVGCGSKWGAAFTTHLSNLNYHIDLVTSSDSTYQNTNTIKVNWFELNSTNIKSLLNQEKHYDLIFFNQNSGGSVGEHHFSPGNVYDIEKWNYHNWINCQLPYIVIQHLSKSITDTTKIGWMMTGLIVGHEKDKFRYAGYASVKSTNLHIMRGFSEFHPGIFFAINPGWFPEAEYQKDAQSIEKVIDNLTKADSGKAFNKDGSFWL